MNEIQSKDAYQIMEKVIIEGDLSKLTSKERIEYYNRVCESLNLNPLTRPFSYIKFDGKLTLYVSKDATEQLRKLNKVSIVKLEKEMMDGIFICTAYAENGIGQKDISTGAVSIKGLAGKQLSNAIKVSETQAKRRVTLSICGLGWTEESEVQDIPNAQPVDVNFETGEIIHQAMPQLSEPEVIETKVDRDLDADLDHVIHASSIQVLQNIFTVLVQTYHDMPDALAKLIAAKDQRKLELKGNN